MRRFLFILTGLLLLTAAAFSAEKVSHRTRYHYEMRDDLYLHFSNADAVIEAIRQGLRRRDDTIIVNYRPHSNNMDEISEIVRELMQYASAETDRPDEGDYILYQYGGYEMQYSYRKEQDVYYYTIRILPALYSDRKQEKKVNEKIAALMEKWNFSGKTSDYDKIRTVYDYVRANTEYDRIHQKNPHYHLKSTAYGTLINGHALCQGYAVTVYRLLRECGVNCRIITGTAVSPDGHPEAHAWNIAVWTENIIHPMSHGTISWIRRHTSFAVIPIFRITRRMVPLKLRNFMRSIRLRLNDIRLTETIHGKENNHEKNTECRSNRAEYHSCCRCQARVSCLRSEGGRQLDALPHSREYRLHQRGRNGFTAARCIPSAKPKRRVCAQSSDCCCSGINCAASEHDHSYVYDDEYALSCCYEADGNPIKRYHCSYFAHHRHYETAGKGVNR